MHWQRRGKFAAAVVCSVKSLLCRRQTADRVGLGVPPIDGGLLLSAAEYQLVRNPNVNVGANIFGRRQPLNRLRSPGLFYAPRGAK
jgi:hypothetical protein